MKEMDLLEAMGQVQEPYLTESEAAAPTGHISAKGKLWRIGLVAALVCLLATAVAAAPSILSAVTGGKLNLNSKEYPYISIYGPGAEGMTDGFEEKLQIQADPNAPATLETPHIPQTLLEDYPNCTCILADYGLKYHYKYTFEDGTTADIRYEQYVIPESEDGYYRAIVRGCYDDFKVEKQMIRCGDTIVFELTYTGGTSGPELRQLYWSDGMYIYYLMLPYEVDAEFYEDLIQNNGPVEDITPYLTADHRFETPGPQEASIPD